MTREHKMRRALEQAAQAIDAMLEGPPEVHDSKLAQLRLDIVNALIRPLEGQPWNPTVLSFQVMFEKLNADRSNDDR